MQRWISDTEPSTRFSLYTRANVGEVFPDPVFPFSKTTMMEQYAEHGWRDAWFRMGAFEPSELRDDEMDTLGIFGGYCYLNAAMIRLFGERAPGLSAQAMDDQFFGVQPGLKPYAEAPGDARPDLSEKIGAWMGYVLTANGLPELYDDQAMTKKLRAERPDFSAMSDEQLFDHTVNAYDKHFRHLFGQHIHATYAASVPVGVLAAVTAAIGRPELLTTLLSGVGDVDSVAPSLEMWKLGRLVRNSPVLTEEFNKGVAGLPERLAARADGDSTAFLAALAAFQYEFGSRGPNEWEPARPTWETKPSLALGAIDRMRLAPDSADPVKHQAVLAAERAKADEEVRATLEAAGVDAETKAQYEMAYASVPTWLPGRERTKTNCVRFIQEGGRLPMRELGRRMVERGHFDYAEDFAFLTKTEFPQMLADPAKFKEVIQSRRAQWDELSAHDPQFLFEGTPDFPNSWIPKSAKRAAALKPGDTLQGIAGCVGSATGRARIVLDSNDPTALEPGDVLVAPATDPSWTPLFVSAGAVIVDVGAPLSHAVIVSRELGIPCVISATDATKRIADGALVRVDGTSGLVTVLEG